MYAIFILAHYEAVLEEENLLKQHLEQNRLNKRFGTLTIDTADKAAKKMLINPSHILLNGTSIPTCSFSFLIYAAKVGKVFAH